jgi:integrase
MPKKSPILTVKTVENLRDAGRYAVGGCDGLCVYVKNGRRYWVLRVTDPHGRRRELGLGPYLRGTDEAMSDGRSKTLEQAREAGRALRRKIFAGADPSEERRAEKARAKLTAAKHKTFRECAAACVEALRPGWRNPKHIQQWQNTLSFYAHPKIGDLDINDIDTGLVLEVLQQPVETNGAKESLWTTRNETASRLRGRLEKIFDWAIARNLRQGGNPAKWRGHLDNLLPHPGKVQKGAHQPALRYAEIGRFMSDLRQRQGISPRALEFVVLTAARSGEVLGAKWCEIDIQAGTWTIPASRMKARKDHTIPLSGEAVDLLKALPHFEGSDFIFPAPRGGMMTDMALTQLVRRMDAELVKAGGAGHRDSRQGGRVVTVHGFRSTFRDWGAETTAYPREVLEHALAHRLADATEAAYQRGSLLEKRRRLMGDWSKFCGTPSGTGAEVVPIRGRSKRTSS